jgi:hypothetical protein
MVDNAIANAPAGHEDAVIKWDAKQGMYNPDGTLVSANERSAWEVSGGNFVLGGDGICDYVLGVENNRLKVWMRDRTTNPPTLTQVTQFYPV